MRDYEEKSYYEIQLDNKQLILVFLAAVTVCVLIFVLGVMIGKGQKEAEFAATARDEKKSAANESDLNAPQEALADAATDAEAEDKPVVKQPLAEKPAPVVEKTQKETKKPAVEETKPPEKFAYEDLDKTDPPSVAAAEKAKEPAPAPAPATTSTPVEEDPKPEGNSRYTVQVMATSSKPKAEEQISRLKSKGYQPFIDESKTGDISVFKVRVGRFADTQEAKEMASKIKTDMKLETWVAVLE